MYIQSTELEFIFHDPPIGMRSAFISRARVIYCDDAVVSRQKVDRWMET